MSSFPFALVDVFARQVLTGNPLAVVADADDLTESVMRSAAIEFRQSETTFILTARDPRAAFRLRSFTPSGEEVVGAGHNSLGAWWWLAENGRLDLRDGVNVLHQELGEHVLPLEIEAAAGRPVRVTLHQPSAEFLAEVSDQAELANALGVPDRHVVGGRVVSTGVAHLLVEVSAPAVLEQLQPQSSTLKAILANLGGQGCYVWARGSADGETSARFFNPTVGIHEDAATGSAAGPLAALLVRQASSLVDQPVTIHQGQAMGRPSRLQLVVNDDGVRLSGECVTSVMGALAYPISEEPRWA